MGALARHGGLDGATAAAAAFGPRFPLGTLIVNVAGSFVMGWLFALFAERMHVAPEVRLIVMTGFLGAFTTFSTFSVETLALLQAGRWLAGAANVAAERRALPRPGGSWLGTLLVQPR